MKNLYNIFLVATLSLFLNNLSFAQVTVTPNQTAAVLMNSLVDGATVTVSKPSLVCNGQANGTFTNTGATLTAMPIASGVILCTGKAKEAEGPNKDDATRNVVPSDQVWATTSWGNNTSDPDLEKLSGGAKLIDVCKLEMDISSIADTLYVEYVFGSEEYETYIGSGDFNDVFGFFISGPNLVNSQNFALVPGTNSVISVNTINANNNSKYYIANLPPAVGSKAGTIQYNGYTKNLVAKFPVIKNATYHLKFAIGDKGDGNVDSGVFLKGGSIKAVTTPVSMLYFKASNMNKDAHKIIWGTASEKNNVVFEILRSTDALNFQVIGKVNGGGNSVNYINYEFIDNHPLPGMNYYKLKAIDYDGKSMMTKVLAVEHFSSIKTLSIYPNPITNSADVAFYSPSEANVSIEMIDLSGKSILSQHIQAHEGENIVNLNTELLIQGSYFLKISSPDMTSTYSKILK